MTKTAILKHSKKDSWKIFDHISNTYDLNNHILSLGLDFYWRWRVSRHIPKKNCLDLLDLATGTGDQIFSIMKRCKKVKAALGIDMSEEMLRIGNRKLMRKKYSHQVSLLKGSATDIALKDSSIDCATMSFGIRNIENMDLCLAETHRVLSTQGKFLILEFSLPKSQLLKSLHLFYLRKILPRIGGLISKNTSAYTYLNKTIETFPYGEELCKEIKKAGFSDVKAYPLTFGIVTLYVATK